jgi:uncharacterized protein (TIGR00266 family)
MEFKIEHAPVFTSLSVQLQAGEAFKAEAGAMVSMSPSVEIQSKKQGKGLGGMLKAAVGGESMFASLFTASGGAGEVVLAPATPGDIIEFDMRGNTILAQSGAYLAGSDGLELSTQGSFKAMISGEGLFLQKISGNGKVFLNSFGAVFVRELAPGEHYILDTGHLVAFEESASYTLKKAAKSLFSTLASGEGLVCDFVGPGKVWVQTRNLKGFAGLIASLMPKQN